MKTQLFTVLVIGLLSVPTFAADVKTVESVVNVGATTTEVSARATRRILIIQNYSDTTIYCRAGGNDAVVGEGWILNPQPAAGEAGGSIFFDVAVPIGAINCIHDSTGNKVVSISEG
jgi:hypothetical protein